MRKQVAQGCLALGLLAGCRSAKPTFDWDVIPEVSMEQEGEISLDPREERILVAPGRHPVDPSMFRGMVMASLMHKGYKPVAPEQAKLWVSVHALGEGDGPKPVSAKGMTPVAGHVSVVVELFQPNKEQPCWRGTVDLPPAKPGEQGGDPALQLERLLEPIRPAKIG